MNFNTFVSAVQLELNDYSARTKLRVEGYVNAGHKLICQKRSWDFLNVKTSDDMTFAPSAFPIDITTDIKVATVATAAQEINAIYDITDGTFDEIKQSTLEQVRAMFDINNAQDSTPDYWYFVGDTKIQFFPSISASRIFQFSFKKKLITYATGATTALLIPDSYIETLKEYVLYLAYRFKADDRATASYEAYQQFLDGMISAEANKFGMIDERPSGFNSVFPRIVDNS